mgnify:CR=1 FL=1
MIYGNASYIPALALTFAVVVLFYVWMFRRRRSLMRRFADKRLIDGITPNVSYGRKVFKTVLVVLALGLLFITMARPQWGFEWQEVKRTGLDILIAIDVSKSMVTKDVKPDRLERSKFAVKDVVKKLAGDRIGLIAFSGSAFLQCPLTIDYNGFLMALDDLNTATIPRAGTSIASAIKEASDIFGGPDKKFKALVIITDGEELEGDALAAAREAAKSGIRIYCVGVGTSEGDLIPTVNDSGDRSFLTDKAGNAVKSRLNEQVLKDVALSTGGSYVKATQAEFGLSLLYDTCISKLEKRELESKMKKRLEERYQIFLALAIVLLFIVPLI